MKTYLILLIIVLSPNLYAQEIKVEIFSSFSISIQQLPEYVVVTSKNTKLNKGIDY